MLSGPSFAAEVARGLPTAVTLAAAMSGCASACRRRSARRRSASTRSDDVIGAQLGGAAKNVLAIACGIVEGKGWATTRGRR